MSDPKHALMHSADNSLDIIRDLEDEVAQINGFYELKLAELKKWRDDELMRVQKARDYQGAQLRQLSISMELHKAKKRSLALPGGRFGYRKGRARVEVEDKLKAEAWCQTRCPEAVGREVTTKIDKREILNYIQHTGEEPEEDSGLRYIEASDSFFVTPTEKRGLQFSERSDDD
jgi:hypothetical protein